MEYLKKEVQLFTDINGNLAVRKGSLRFSILHDKEVFLTIFRQYENGMAEKWLLNYLKDSDSVTCKKIHHFVDFFKKNNLITGTNNYGPYDRQIRYFSIIDSALDEFDAQKKLENSSILVIGIGGLGSHIASGLSSVGVKSIGLCDADKVEVSNLSRCLGYKKQDIGQLKTTSLSRHIKETNPNCEIQEFNFMVDPENFELVNKYDFVIVTIDKNNKRDFELLNFLTTSKTPLIFANYGEQFGEISKICIETPFSQLSDLNHRYKNISKNYCAPSTLWITQTLSGIIIKEVVAYLTGVGKSRISERTLRLDLNELTVSFV